MIYNYKARINIIRALPDLIWFMPRSDPLIQVFIINPFPSLITFQIKFFRYWQFPFPGKVGRVKFPVKFFPSLFFFPPFLLKVICLVIVWRFVMEWSQGDDAFLNWYWMIVFPTCPAPTHLSRTRFLYLEGKTTRLINWNSDAMSFCLP